MSNVGGSLGRLGPVAVVVAALCQSACATDDVTPDEVAARPEQTPGIASRQFRDPLLLVPRWPFDDGSSQYRLVWNGGETTLPLFEEPDPQSRIVGQLSYKDGETIETAGDYLSVYRPNQFRAKRRLTVEGKVHGSAGPSDRVFSRVLERGDTLNVYGYAGGVQCYLGAGGKIFVGQCPTPEDFNGRFDGPSLPYQMQPVEKVWWVRIETPVKSGWAPLDVRVFADIFPLDSAPPSGADDTSVATTDKPSGDSTVPPPTDTELDREAALFGGGDDSGALADASSSTDSSKQGTTSTTSGGDLGEPLMTAEDIEERLEAQEDPLTVGAFTFLQAQYFTYEEGAPEEWPLSTPSLLDVYLDARPSPRVRGYARGRLTANFSLNSETQDVLGEELEPIDVELDQLWVNFDIGRAVFATLGRQHVKWGTGRFWNPTDFLSSRPRDPLEVATFDTRLGVTLAKLHLPIEKLGWNFYAIAVLEEASTPEEVGGALRGEFLFGLTEVSLSATAQKGQPYRAGFDLSTGIWLFDLRFEGAALYRDPRPYYRGIVDPPRFLPVESSREDQILPQAVMGADLQIPYRRGDLLILGGEYFYNGTGYADEELYPWLFFNDRFLPYYAGRRYAGAYAALLGPGSWDDTSIFATGLANLSDESYLARIDVSQLALDYLRWNVFANYHFGTPGEFNYSLELEPNIFVPDGIDIDSPLIDVGIGVQMDL